MACVNAETMGSGIRMKPRQMIEDNVLLLRQWVKVCKGLKLLQEQGWVFFLQIVNLIPEIKLRCTLPSTVLVHATK